MIFILADATQKADALATYKGIKYWTFVGNRKQLINQSNSTLYIIKGWEKRDCLLLQGIMKTSILIFKRRNEVIEWN